MPVLIAVLWGLLGGAAVEGLQFIADGRRVGGWPWRSKKSPSKGFYLAAMIVRLSVGGIVAGALGASAQINTAVAALLAGIAAPLLVERASQGYVAGLDNFAENHGAVARGPARQARVPRNLGTGGVDAD
jgi:hypothetical protein